MKTAIGLPPTGSEGGKSSTQLGGEINLAKTIDAMKSGAAGGSAGSAGVTGGGASEKSALQSVLESSLSPARAASMRLRNPLSGAVSRRFLLQQNPAARPMRTTRGRNRPAMPMSKTTRTMSHLSPLNLPLPGRMGLIFGRRRIRKARFSENSDKALSSKCWDLKTIVFRFVRMKELPVIHSLLPLCKRWIRFAWEWSTGTAMWEF